MLKYNSYLFIATDLRTRTIAYCDRYPQEVGTPLGAFLRKYLSAAYVKDYEVVFDYDEMEKYICERGDSRAIVLNSSSAKRTYRFGVYTDLNDPNIIYTSFFILEDSKDAESGPYTIDYLTGVLNRAAACENIEGRLAKQKKGRLIIIDLDNFKKVNDTRGHVTGDDCLKTICAQIRSVCGDRIVGRYGGDEFVVWDETESEDEFGEFIRKLLDVRYVIPASRGIRRIEVSVSCGVSIYPQDGTSFLQLFSKADKALYRAKNEGGNIGSVYGSKSLIGKDVQPVKRLKNKVRRERLFNKEIRAIKLRRLFAAAAIAIVLICSTLFISSSFSGIILEMTKTEAKDTMAQFSTQLSQHISVEIDGYFTQLEMANTSVNSVMRDTDMGQTEDFGIDEQADDYKTLYDVLKEVSAATDFDMVGVLFESGDLQFADFTYNIASENFAQKLTLGDEEEKKQVVDSIYFNGRGEAILFGVPYKRTNESAQASSDTDRIVGVVGSVSPDVFTTILHTEMFGNSSSVHMVRQDGTLVAACTDENNTFAGENILNVISNYITDDKLDSLAEAFKSTQSGTVEVSADGVDYLIYYTEIVSDGDSAEVSAYSEETTATLAAWRIVTIIPSDALASNMLTIYNISRAIVIMLLVLICLIVAGFTVWIIVSDVRGKRFKYTDPITGGINKDRFTMDAVKLLKMGSYAVVSVNICRFKYVNEQVGHELADEMLAHVYHTIDACLENDELVTHSYEDRYIMLVRGDERVESRLKAIYNKLCAEDYGGGTTQLAFTFGAYLVADANANFGREDVFSHALDRARFARQQAKSPDDPIVWFNDVLMAKELEGVELEQKARRALDNEEFIVYYQLKRNIQTDEWCGAEALVRWLDPAVGLVSPGKFIPVFERNGFIVELDKYVFEQVCRNLRIELNFGKKAVTVSVNVSRRHLDTKNFLDEYVEIIDRYNVPHELIEFELTESFVMDSAEALKAFVRRVHSFGCSCSIDDFGSGYSSLNMLSEFDFDVVKLDRKFFYSDKGFNDESKKVVSAIIKLAHELGMRVIAEGIEEPDQSDFLRDAGCDAIQGYLYAKPCPHSDYLKKL